MLICAWLKPYSSACDNYQRHVFIIVDSDVKWMYLSTGPMKKK